MALQVRATRMELLQLKRRVRLARRGHKLLKDKLDELMRQFKILIADYEGARAGLERELHRAYSSFLFARAAMHRESLHDALAHPGARAVITTETRRIMNLTLPVFRMSLEGNVRNYGLFDTPPELDEALAVYRQVLPSIVRLAEQEKAIILIAHEIDSTRRRVNALEYVLIPDYESAISRVKLKLSEMDRSNTTRLMKVKEMADAKRSF
jgi:V/A-type H+-transporting ATPase subunit D